MKRYLKQLKPNVFEDIIAMVALYRPGPMEWIPDFIAGKHGKKIIKYLHPKLEPILKNTYGVAVYQEQIMQIARDLAGFTMGEADVLRKAMGKKIPELIKEERTKFIKGCIKNNIPKKVAEKVFDFIEPFAGYGFNRSHATCYALIGYQTAYLKAHYPAEFIAALLTSDQDDIDRIAIEVAEAEEMGIEVLPPNINESFEEFAVIIGDDKIERIRFGLNAIKNVGKTVAHEIVEERKRNGKYKSLAEFIERVQHKDLNRKSLESLAKVGALDELAERNKIIASIDNILNFSKNVQKFKNSSQLSLFSEETLSPVEIPLIEVEPASSKQKLQWEKELLGLYVSDHPVSGYKEYLEKFTFPINSLDNKLVGNKIKLGGVISKIQKVLVRSQNSAMLFVTLEDLQGRIELLVFPKVLERTGGVWEEDNIIIAEGKLSDKEGVFKLIVDEAKIISPVELENFKRILVTQQKNSPKQKIGTIIYNDPNKLSNETYSKERNKESSKDYGENYNYSDNYGKNYSENSGDFSGNKTTNKITKLIITLPQNSNQETIKKLSAFFDQCSAGTMKVYLNINGARLETPYSINNKEELKEELKKLIPEGKIDIY